MTKTPHILVVVVTYNSDLVVGDCLTALPDAFRHDATYRIVVADNASTDRTEQIVRVHAPDATVLALDRNRGYAAGINAAIEHGLDASVEAVLVLNPDVRLAAGSLEPLLQSLSAASSGIAVPRLVDAAGELMHSLRREPSVLRAIGEAVLGGERAGRWTPLGELVVGAESYARPTTAAWATGAAMLISRRCLDAVGAWDESYFLYSEETDFCLRARDAGYVLRYEPAACAVHLGGESNTSPLLWSLLTRNRVRWFRRRHGALRGAAFFVAVLLNEGLRATCGRPTNRAAFTALLTRRALPFPPVDSATDGYVCFSAQDWWYFNRGHSDFQLMTRVAHRYPVLLVNSLGMRMPTPASTSAPWSRIWRKVCSARRGLRAPLASVPGFHVFTPVFLPAYGDGPIARLNRRLVLAQVRWALKRIEVRRPTVVVTLPTAWPIARKLERSRTIAYRSDRYSALPEADQELVAELERQLLAAADVALFASTALYAEEASMTGHPAMLAHGVDTERFLPVADLRAHPRLADIGRPRVGYVGTIDAYTVDLELLAQVARDHPEVELVLAGPIDTDITDLTAYPNVHHLGSLPFDEVPAFLAGLDVTLMPWQQNEWIQHCNPIKLKEYLAVGLPVVSTDFPEVRRFGHVIAVAHDADDFSLKVREALDGHGRSTSAERRAAVGSETWDVQAERLMALADQHPDRIDPEAVCEPCVAS